MTSAKRSIRVWGVCFIIALLCLGLEGCTKKDIDGVYYTLSISKGEQGEKIAYKAYKQSEIGTISDGKTVITKIENHSLEGNDIALSDGRKISLVTSVVTADDKDVKRSYGMASNSLKDMRNAIDVPFLIPNGLVEQTGIN